MPIRSSSHWKKYDFRELNWIFKFSIFYSPHGKSNRYKHSLCCFHFFMTPPPKNSRHVRNTLHLPRGNIQPISSKSYFSSLFRPRTITVYIKKCQPSLRDDCWWLADGAKKIENTNRDDPKTLKHWPPMARKTNIMETHNAGARWVSIYLYIYICFWCSEGKGLRMRTV